MEAHVFETKDVTTTWWTLLREHDRTTGPRLFWAGTDAEVAIRLAISARRQFDTMPPLLVRKLDGDPRGRDPQELAALPCAAAELLDGIRNANSTALDALCLVVFFVNELGLPV